MININQSIHLVIYIKDIINNKLYCYSKKKIVVMNDNSINYKKKKKFIIL